MTNAPPLTRYLGKAERTLQALLQSRIVPAGLSFPEWTILTFLNGTGQMNRDQIIQAMIAAQIADSREAAMVLDGMIAKGLVRPDNTRLTIAEAGSKVFLPLRSAVEGMIAQLVDGIPAGDLEATRRTLDTMTKRATSLLSSA